MKYALKRLITGLGVGRETARPCYSLALAQVRWRLLEGPGRAARSGGVGGGADVSVASKGRGLSGRRGGWRLSGGLASPRGGGKVSSQAYLQRSPGWWDRRVSKFSFWVRGLSSLWGTFTGLSELCGGLGYLCKVQGSLPSRGTQLVIGLP